MNSDIFKSFDDIFDKFPIRFPSTWTYYQSSKPSSGDESAWLIEKAVGGGPMWWTGIVGTGGWSMDANEAVRFSRKQDAERTAVYALGKFTAGQCTITEHLWCPTDPKNVKSVKPVDPAPKETVQADEKLKATSEIVRELCDTIQCLPTDLLKAVEGIRNKQRASHGQAVRLQAELNEIKRKRDERSAELGNAKFKLAEIRRILDT